MVLEVPRSQVLAYRAGAQGLWRDGKGPADLAVLDLGVQDTNVGSARLALAARLAEPEGGPVEDPAFTLLWSVRGAPHLHRTADLPALAGALWPLSDADAMARLPAERGPFKAAGLPGLAAFTAAASALRDVVTEPLTKGEVSTAVTARLPAVCSRWCPSCDATHIYGGLFQTAGLFAAVHLLPERPVTTLAPLPGRYPLPAAPSGTADLIRAYLRLHGPATLADAAGFLGSSPTALRPAWPADLAEVRVDGKRAWIPAEHLAELRDAAAIDDLVRLLPPADPFLQARDRNRLVPDRARQKAVWRMIANPGALLAGGEVAGVWRGRGAGRGRFEITVQPFDALDDDRRAAVATEAERVAAARGAADVRVRYADA